MTYNQHYREEYHDWELDQHTAVMLQQMERQIREGKSFVNIFVWSSRWKEYLSKGGRVSDNNCESLWIFRRGNREFKIPMWNGERIINPLLAIPRKKPSLKALCRRLEILRRAYSGTNKINPILDQIEEIERDEDRAIDEIIGS